MTKAKQDYPYLRAWCRMMGSKQYYTDMQIERARDGTDRTRANPFTAYRFDGALAQPRMRREAEVVVR